MSLLYSKMHVQLWHEKVKLHDKSPSVIQFSIHPSSTVLEQHISHGNIQSLIQAQIIGQVVEVDRKQFFNEPGKSYMTISNMLPDALQIESNARDLLVRIINCKALVALAWNKNARKHNTKWLFSVEIHVVTTTWLDNSGFGYAGQPRVIMVPATVGSLIAASLEEGENCSISSEESLEVSNISDIDEELE